MARETNTPRMVVAGLTIVHCEGKVYLGKLGSDDERVAGNNVFLRGAIELLFQRKVSADGVVQATSMPAYVFPMERPVDLAINPSLVINVSEEQNLIELYDSLIGRPSLVIPALSR